VDDAGAERERHGAHAAGHGEGTPVGAGGCMLGKGISLCATAKQSLSKYRPLVWAVY
jgi:hypothetical protein